MEVRGLTAVDSLYEYAGYRLAGELVGVFQQYAVGILVGLIGIGIVVYRIAQGDSPHHLLLHCVYLMLMAWLFSPLAVSFGRTIVETRNHDTEAYNQALSWVDRALGFSVLPRGKERSYKITDQPIVVRAPRFALYVNQAVDTIMEAAILRINVRFKEAPFEWARIAYTTSSARIYDSLLKEDFGRFVERCHIPLLAKEGVEEPQNPLSTKGQPSYGPLRVRLSSGENRACSVARGELRSRLDRYVETDPHQKGILAPVAEHEPGRYAEFRRFFVDKMAENEFLMRNFDRDEFGRVVASMGSYDPAMQTFKLPVDVSWLSPISAVVGRDSVNNAVAKGLNVLAGSTAEANASFYHEVNARQMHYSVIQFAPHLYGLVVMFLIGLFPLVGLWSLLPGRWTALVHFGKVFTSVKLWPVLWSCLSLLNQGQSRVDEAVYYTVPGAVTGGTVFWAIASMYLAAPLMAFLVIQMATSAGTIAFQTLVPTVPSPDFYQAADRTKGMVLDLKRVRK